MAANTFDPKDFLQNILLSGKSAFVLPEGEQLANAVMKELGPGFSRMGERITLSIDKKQELRAKLLDNPKQIRNQR